ncbi:MAG: 3-hydroxyacyl-CoA dehydrogenase NAD-binding domain-containing protein, partial [Myxococcota bacterium]
PKASIGLPEVKLGLLPGAGGTQRFPRAVGLETAANMIVSGEPAPAKMLKGLFAELIEGDLVEGAVAFAGKIADARPLPKLRDQKVEHPSPEGFLHVAEQMVGAATKGYPAPSVCLEVVAKSVSGSFDAGLKAEREAFLKLIQTPESAALRHLFFSERLVSQIPDVPKDTPQRPLESAAVLGAGTMGSGIAMCLLAAGIPTVIYERAQDALDRGVGKIREYFEGRVKKGRMSPEKAEAAVKALTPTLELKDVKDADIVIEAVFEDMEVKKAIFTELDGLMKPGAILASNTSTLDLDAIAAVTKRPGDVIGTHFFSPAQVMRLLEVVRGKETSKDVLATVMALGKRIRKTSVVSGVCDGFIGNRMVGAYVRQALLLVEEGAMPAQVDKALEKWGMAMGPFRMSDLSGNDIGWAIRKRQYAADSSLRKALIADRLCEAGRFGQKTGKGWYTYAGRKALPDPEVDAIIVQGSKDLGIERRKVSSEEIIQRTILALVNEGARILEEKIALRASDIDMVYITGYGFPPFRGGPMHYAESMGLYNVVRAMEGLTQTDKVDSAFWTPAAVLKELAASGKTFRDWSAS